MNGDGALVVSTRPCVAFRSPCWTVVTYPRNATSETFGDMFHPVRVCHIVGSLAMRERHCRVPTHLHHSKCAPRKRMDLPASPMSISFRISSDCSPCYIHSIPTGTGLSCRQSTKNNRTGKAESGVSKLSNRKVGLVWDQKPKEHGQQERSVPLLMLLLMTQTDGVSFLVYKRAPAHSKFQREAAKASRSDCLSQIFRRFAALLLQLLI
jgi:hypothetical protein